MNHEPYIILCLESFDSVGLFQHICVNLIRRFVLSGTVPFGNIFVRRVDFRDLIGWNQSSSSWWQLQSQHNHWTETDWPGSQQEMLLPKTMFCLVSTEERKCFKCQKHMAVKGQSIVIVHSKQGLMIREEHRGAHCSYTSLIRRSLSRLKRWI